MLELSNMVKHGIDPETQKRSLHIQTICKIDLVGCQRLGTCWFDLHLGFDECNYMLHLYVIIRVMRIGMLPTYFFL